jgi:hypothetical protein
LHRVKYASHHGIIFSRGKKGTEWGKKGKKGTECAGINRHVVGDERALQERGTSGGTSGRHVGDIHDKGLSRENRTLPALGRVS